MLLDYIEYESIINHRVMRYYPVKDQNKFKEILFEILEENQKKDARNRFLIASGGVLVTEGVSQPLYNK